MSAGDGYKYLLRTVAAGDGDRSLSTPLTRYYAEEGSPPGRWLGAGVAALAGGESPGADVLDREAEPAGDVLDDLESQYHVEALARLEQLDLIDAGRIPVVSTVAPDLLPRVEKFEKAWGELLDGVSAELTKAAK